MSKIRRRGLFTVLLAGALSVSACAGGDALQESDKAPKGTVVVGSTNFPEQLILANMYAAVLEDRGVKVETRLNISTREVVFPALKSGDLSVVPEYSGALLSELTGGNATARKPDEVMQRLRAELPKGIKALEPAPAQNKDALVVTQETAQKHDLQTVSDLKGVADEMLVAGPPEFEERAAGAPGYKKVYGIEFKDLVKLDAGGRRTKEALKQGKVEVARLFTTDPAIKRNNWVLLKDDKNLIPAQNLLPVGRDNVLTPKMEQALNKLSSKLTTNVMLELNGKLADGGGPEEIAKQWLKKEGLIGTA